MRPKTVLALLFIVLALLAFIWFYERDLPSSDERLEMAKKALVFDVDEVEAIELEREGERLRIVRASSDPGGEDGDRDPDFVEQDWRLEEPLMGRADVDLVDGLLSELETLERLRALDDTPASEAGLDSPRATLSLYTESAVRRLRVGSEVPASETMIVSIDDEELLVVSRSLWDSLSRAPGEWRSKDLYLGDRDDIESVLLETETGAVRLSRRGKELWIEEPLVDLADRERTVDLLGSIVGLRAHAFIDDAVPPLSELGLEPPVARIEVRAGSGREEFELDWGLPVEEGTGRHYARVEDQVVETSAPLGEVLQLGPEEWRSRGLTSFETHEIDALRVLDDSGEMILKRDGADWNRDDEKVSFTTVSDLLYALVDAEAVGVESPGGSVDSVQRESTLELTISGAEMEEVLTIGPTIEAGVPAWTSSREAVLILTPELYEEIRQKVEAVRSAAPVGAESPALSGEESGDSNEQIGEKTGLGATSAHLPEPQKVASRQTDLGRFVVDISRARREGISAL